MDMFVAFRMQRRKEKVDARERELLERADVVFTGGPSLQMAKQGVNPRTHCFPSGLDVDPFAAAAERHVDLPPDVAELPRPVFGYWGAVDERIDFELLGRLCDKFPKGSVVLLGPLIGMQTPPVEKPNFHYLGAKHYTQLPGYLAAFNVCLMPFVDSPLTSSISPTKTPEYLAGGKPVVSTPIPDVVSVWGDVVSVTKNHDEFVAAAERELTRRIPDPRLARIARERADTWDNIAARMRERIEAALK
jgi:glycosyltransferase involved in cell wall biosynthesis